MSTREAYRAGSFYPSDAQACSQKIDECLGTYQPPEEPSHIVAGIVPHAGWVFSGPTAAKVFKSIFNKSSPETFLIFGAVHVWGVGTAALYAEGAWETPCGNVAIDEELANLLLEHTIQYASANASAHNREHSIEVQIPFIQHLFSDAAIVPIMVSPGPEAVTFGQKVGEIVAGTEKYVVILGSTDLTHYGPSFGFSPYGVGEQALHQMKENDRRIIELTLQMKADDVIQEASQHRNACGAGAIAATVAAANVLGAKQGYLLEHTTSHDVMPERPATDAVGYAGVVF